MSVYTISRKPFEMLRAWIFDESDTESLLEKYSQDHSRRVRRAAIEKYRKSIKNILDSSNVKISKLLGKIQAAKFKELTERSRHDASAYG